MFAATLEKRKTCVWSPYCRRVYTTQVPGEVVALTRYRGMQFSSLYLGQGESPPRVSVEMRENEYE